MELKADDITRGKWIINSSELYNKTRVTIQEASDGTLVVCIYGKIKLFDRSFKPKELKKEKKLR